MPDNLADLRKAKRSLMKRWTPPLRRETGRATALRAERRFRPDVPLNLVGVGVGEKITSGRLTGTLCVKVLVARKYPLGRIPAAQRIPAAVAGLPTDIEEVGYPRALPAARRGGRRRPGRRPAGRKSNRRRRAADLDSRRRRRPVPGGVSVGLDSAAVSFRFAGTLGVILVDRDRPTWRLGLSNNHVLADENRVAAGAGAIQPGSLDGGRDSDRIGSLDRFEPIRFGNVPNSMDAAACVFEAAADADFAILGVGAPTGVAEPELRGLVRKMGRTTGLTEGIVRAVDFDVTGVQYDQGLVRVDDVVVIEGVGGEFSAAGDSGSAIVDARSRLVALLFAGSSEVTFAIPIGRVLDRLRLGLPRAGASRRR